MQVRHSTLTVFVVLQASGRAEKLKSIAATSESGGCITAVVDNLLASRSVALAWLLVGTNATTLCGYVTGTSIGIILRILDLLFVDHVSLALLVFLLAIVGTTSNRQNGGLVVFRAF